MFQEDGVNRIWHLGLHRLGKEEGNFTILNSYVFNEAEYMEHLHDGIVINCNFYLLTEYAGVVVLRYLDLSGTAATVQRRRWTVLWRNQTLQVTEGDTLRLAFPGQVEQKISDCDLQLVHYRAKDGKLLHTYTVTGAPGAGLIPLGTIPISFPPGLVAVVRG
jgi:hypothetical protein